MILYNRRKVNTMKKIKKIAVFVFMLTILPPCFPKQKINTASATPEERIENFPFTYKNDKNNRSKIAHKKAIINYIKDHQSSKSSLSPEKIYENADSLCKIYNIDIDYIIAIMRQESRYYQGAVGPKFKVNGRYRRAYGICQIVYEGAYDTARWHGGPQYSWEDVINYNYANIDVACYYLTYTWKYHNGVNSTEELICAYNAGPYNVSEYLNRENYNYVKNVMKYVNEIKDSY